MDAKCANPELQLDVDILILDYQLHQTIEALLAERQSMHAESKGRKSDNAILSLDELPSEIRFRLQLVQFLTLFCRRFKLDSTTPDPDRLKELRAKNSLRSRIWTSICKDNSTSFSDWHGCRLPSRPPGSLAKYRFEVLQPILRHVPQWAGKHFGSSSYVTLLDILPMFMSISAMRAGNLEPTGTWMDLAGHFMLQAALEQALFRGNHSTAAVGQAFAWGYIRRSTIEEDIFDDDQEDVVELNEMFKRGNEEAEVLGWSKKKRELIKLITADANDPWRNLGKVARQHGLLEFEAKLLEYMQFLAASITTPVLAQLEKGEIDGLSKEETIAFKQRVGLLPSGK